MFEIRGQDFGELARGRHDEALVGARPRDEVLDALVFEHVVQLVDEGRLHDLWLLSSGSSADGGRGVPIGRRVARVGVSFSLRLRLRLRLGVEGAGPVAVGRGRAVDGGRAH